MKNRFFFLCGWLVYLSSTAYGQSEPTPTYRFTIGGHTLVKGNLTADTLTAKQALRVGTNATITQNLLVNGFVGLGVMPGSSDRLTVGGNTTVNGLLTTENLTVKQSLDIKGTFSVAGTLGVGIAIPQATLHVNGDGQFDGDLRAHKLTVQSIEVAGGQAAPFTFGDNLLVTGSIGVGTAKIEGYKLSVNGKIRASNDIKVYLESGWSDFVFEQRYRLRPLAEVEKHIQQHGHLPEIPSAKEVAKEGIDLGAMDAKLLQKIEELTLYMIEIKKEVTQLQRENAILKKQMNSAK